jgi:hypothetical protein
LLEWHNDGTISCDENSSVDGKTWKKKINIGEEKGGEEKRKG